MEVWNVCVSVGVCVCSTTALQYDITLIQTHIRM